jgi:hypothetical protein
MEQHTTQFALCSTTQGSIKYSFALQKGNAAATFGSLVPKTQLEVTTMIAACFDKKQGLSRYVHCF